METQALIAKVAAEAMMQLRNIGFVMGPPENSFSAAA
jgi:hypothetical protein